MLLGAALLGLALRSEVARSSRLDGPTLAAAQAGNIDGAAALPGAARDSAAAAFVDGFHAAALTAAALAFLAAVLAAVLLREPRAAQEGRS